MRSLSGCLLILVLSWRTALPCTTFCLADGGQVLFGKNYDWDVDHGLLTVNKRGVSRAADSTGSARPARWVSRYGSVTFNQYGRDNPSGGINEAGLVVELMWLEGSAYPAPDQRPAVGVLEWIQYQLDESATVAEVLASDGAVRIAGGTPLHYLVADLSGRVAAIEFLGGQMKAHSGDSLPVAVLTNSTYDNSLAHMRRAPVPAGSGIPAASDSLSRFERTAKRVAGYRRRGIDEALSFAFDTLRNVASSRTQWSIVYDAGEGRVHFKTRRQPAIRSLRLQNLDFSCAGPVMVLDLNAPGGGDVLARLRPYSRESNLSILRSSFSETTFLADVEDEEIRRLSGLPDATRCVEPEASGITTP